MQKDYILILAEIPNKQNEKDGMIQRELAIDSIFSNKKRIYIGNCKKLISVKSILNKFKYVLTEAKPKSIILKITKRINRRFKTHNNNNKIVEQLENENVSILNQVSQSEMYNLIKDAKIVYCHSLHKLRVLPIEYIREFANKIIIDIHGCVVEELKFQNMENYVIEEFKHYEEVSFSNVNSLVVVSKNMMEFYKNKYPQMKTDFIFLPIFSRINIDASVINKKQNMNIIYSGGAQKWQNVDLMLESMNAIANNYKINILTPNINIFNKKISKFSNLKNNVLVHTVAYNKISEEYINADFGYLLRDDCIVNKVACPTKIIEYLQYGIIPIVLQPEIGDFNKFGYSYILNDDLINGVIPSDEELTKMRINNYNILNELYEMQEVGEKTLLSKINR